MARQVTSGLCPHSSARRYIRNTDAKLNPEMSSVALRVTEKTFPGSLVWLRSAVVGLMLMPCKVGPVLSKFGLTITTLIVCSEPLD